MFPHALQFSTSTFHAGPLPSPDTLHQYNEILPGAADRVVAMAEREQEHRHAVERSMVRIYARNTMGGLIAGTLIGLVAIVGGAYGMVQGADLGGAGVALGGLAALAGVYVVGKKSEERQNQGS